MKQQQLGFVFGNSFSFSIPCTRNRVEPKSAYICDQNKLFSRTNYIIEFKREPSARMDVKPSRGAMVSLSRGTCPAGVARLALSSIRCDVIMAGLADLHTSKRRSSFFSKAFCCCPLLNYRHPEVVLCFVTLRKKEQDISSNTVLCAMDILTRSCFRGCRRETFMSVILASINILTLPSILHISSTGQGRKAIPYRPPKVQKASFVPPGQCLSGMRKTEQEQRKMGTPEENKRAEIRKQSNE
ncbi:hypothetical protein IHE44_0000225 [Lamprotornis superbus]|uniref:Uncharacterized protein n=1 Tax=Lamprotornis superbus TaxID=245042 RepID=A0A835P3C3_9PASS|nr:hypothetical protein IHE44_0000225 [Lamprotornis superbus]